MILTGLRDGVEGNITIGNWVQVTRKVGLDVYMYVWRYWVKLNGLVSEKGST